MKLEDILIIGLAGMAIGAYLGHAIRKASERIDEKQLREAVKSQREFQQKQSRLRYRMEELN